MQTQQKKEEANVSQVYTSALITSKEERYITTREADDINNNFSSLSDCNLFKLDRSFPTNKAHFPSTITSASLRSMILKHGSCRPSGPFEEDGSGRPIFGNKHYFYFSTANLKVA